MAHPVIQAIRSGNVPGADKLAAARAAVPLPPDALLEALIVLSSDANDEVRTAAVNSLRDFDQARMREVVGQETATPDVLQFLCGWHLGSREVYEALTLNPATPAEGITSLAAWTRDGSLLELIAVNQERMIAHPPLIEAILGNKASTPEAARRAREVRIEFFEKELGAKRVAEERRVRAAAISAALGLDRVEESLPDLIDDDVNVEELSSATSLPDGAPSQAGPEFAFALHQELGKFAEALVTPVPAQAAPASAQSEAAEAEARRLADEMQTAGEDVDPQRLTMMQLIARMNVKQRIQLALKGNREARNILKRDSNRGVILGVLGNPRITESEVEAISNMKTLPEEALRLISLNRLWSRNYAITHNLARNPRTPVAISIALVPRLLPKDLKALTTNRNIPDVVRKTAQRLLSVRTPA
jgi:hypothetical protein